MLRHQKLQESKIISRFLALQLENQTYSEKKVKFELSLKNFANCKTIEIENACALSMKLKLACLIITAYFNV